MLTKEQITGAKKQLLEQIQHLPPEQKAQAQEQINSMSDETIEEMLSQQRSSSNKIFRMIVEGEIPSIKLDENEKAIAVLSTKSISKGHTLIIPKFPTAKEKEIPKEAHELSEKISKKIMVSLNAKSASIIAEKNFGEVILNVIPIYDKSLSLQSKREDLPLEDLEKVKSEINIVKISKNPELEKIKIKKPRKAKPLKLKRRIP